MLAGRRTFLGASAALALPRIARADGHTHLTIRFGRDVEVLDPAFRASPEDNTVIWAVFQRLVRFKPGSTEWENDAADEIRQTSPTTVEFRLKPGQAFTDGFGDMTAEDVKFSFERFVRPADGRESPYKSDWANLDRVDVTGPLTGRIVLTHPNAALWRVALADGSGCIVSRKAMTESGARAALRPVGSGPFAVAMLEPQRRVVLRPNPGYGGPTSPWQEIVVRTVPDPKTAELAFRAGELDFTELTPSTVTALRRAPDTAITQSPGLRFVWISLNIEKKPLDDLRVRRAIRMGLDVDQMLLAGYNGLAARANALIQPRVLGHWPSAPVHARDVEGAKTLLAEAGVSGLKLQLTVLNQPEFQTMALVAQAQMRQIGVTLDLDVRDAATYWSAGRGDAGRGLDTAMMRFNGKLDPNFDTQWFLSSQVGAWNWSRWRSPDFDALHAAASTELDEAKRAAIVVRMQELMEDSAAFIWLTYDVDLFASRTWLAPAIAPTGSDWQLAQFALAAPSPVSGEGSRKGGHP